MSAIDNQEHNSVLIKKSEKTNDNESSMPLNLTKEETFRPWKYCLATYEKNNDVSTTTSLKKVKLKTKSQEKDKTFECSWCKKKFGWSTDLKRHLLIHTGTTYTYFIINFESINISSFKIFL